LKRFSIGLVALCAATPASAQVLWENVRAGMTSAELRQLYPAGERVRYRPDRTTIRGFTVSDQCRADVHVVHRAGSVDGVMLRGEAAMFARCGTAVLEALTARHGPAQSETTGRPSIMQRVRTTYGWQLGDVYLRFIRFSTEGWGGAGLGNASWEMTLSTSPEPVRL
jgi:hypothetical protein